MNDSYITARIRRSQLPEALSLEDWINIFAANTHEWYLNIADQLADAIRNDDGSPLMNDSGSQARIPHSDFAALYLVSAYFEMYSKYKIGYVGEGDSKVNWKKGFLEVFQLTGDSSNEDEIAEYLYKKWRCQFYHATHASAIALSRDYELPLSVVVTADGEPNGIMINTLLFVRGILSHFALYVSKLRNVNETKLRENFIKRYSYDLGQPL